MLKETIHVFHTNDLHSQFRYWSRMQQFIQTERKRLEQLGDTTLLIDIGDHIDRSDTYTDATLGKGIVSILNDAHYNVVTIGNNEGITLNHDELRALYEDANFEVVVCNLSARNGDNPAWLKPYKIVQTKHGTKIGMIGVTAAFTPFYHDLQWEIDEPISAVTQLIHLLKDQVDILLCLSHLGKSDDELMAAACPELDVIFGAHTHHVFPEGVMMDNVLLTGGGKFGQYTGVLTIDYDIDKKTVIHKRDYLVDHTMLEEVADEQHYVEQLEQKAKEMLSEPIFTTDMYYNREWFHYSNLSRFFAKAILHESGADCALFNAGIFLEALPKGEVTAYDIHRILPHPINLCVIELSAAELKEALLESRNEEWPLLQLKGLGFRGVVFGKMLHYGFEMDEHRRLLVQGKVVDPEDVFQLVTLDMFTFGYFFPSFKHAKKRYILPQFLRHILSDYGKNTFMN